MSRVHIDDENSMFFTSISIVQPLFFLSSPELQNQSIVRCINAFSLERSCWTLCMKSITEMKLNECLFVDMDTFTDNQIFDFLKKEFMAITNDIHKAVSGETMDHGRRGRRALVSNPNSVLSPGPRILYISYQIL